MTEDQDAAVAKATTPPGSPPPGSPPPASPPPGSPPPGSPLPGSPLPTVTPLGVAAAPTAGSIGLDPLVPTIALPPADYSQAGVPSLDFVRDKIEGRYAHSLGSTELAQETPEAKSFAEQAAKQEEAAKEKLAAIRRSLSGDTPS